MEQRLIDANALKEWLVAQIDYYKKYSGYNCNAMASAYGAVLERIDNEPTVDAVPVVYAKMKKAKGSYWSIGDCTNCKKRVYFIENYCPYCGAKIIGYEDEEPKRTQKQKYGADGERR